MNSSRKKFIPNRHKELEGKHALLSASKYHWIRYDVPKLTSVFRTQKAAQEGTFFHSLAQQLIQSRTRMPRNGSTLNTYVNDGIGFKMLPEVVLAYSNHAFGTADCLGFRYDEQKERWVLRIHDLKMGTNKSSMDQLCIYAAYFCLEYGYSPEDIDIILSIYQNDDVRTLIPEPEYILHIMAKTIESSNLVEALLEEGL